MHDDIRKELAQNMTEGMLDSSTLEGSMTGTSVKAAKVKNAVAKDPFLQYGTGIKNYFLLQE
jgi:hypothetical protein